MAVLMPPSLCDKTAAQDAFIRIYKEVNLSFQSAFQAPRLEKCNTH